ncbi:MAG: RNA polymerase sporulation sigma factor SigK [Clostridia bacterium]|nr:RNA polymerase sporulation sigma factor SigK [Clostridia bacterium]
MLLEIAGLTLSHFLFLYLRVLTGGSFPPPLPKKEEDELFCKMKKGDQKARETLIEHNLRLVAHIIKKYDTEKDEQEDLISIGTIGLIKAIDSFDGSLGIRFATYAGKCVQNEILMYFRSRKKFSVESSIHDAIEVDKDGMPLTILDVLRVEEDLVDRVHLKSRVHLAMHAVKHHLDDRERSVIALRYGLNGQKGLTQREVASKMSISRSYVSRIEKGALEKIRAFLEKPRNYI